MQKNNKLVISILGITTITIIILATICNIYIINLTGKQEITSELTVALLSVVNGMYVIATNIISGLVGYLGGQSKR